MNLEFDQILDTPNTDDYAHLYTFLIIEYYITMLAI